jgi:hypothetical protein
VIAVVALFIVGGGIYLFAGRNHPVAERFPELQPDLAAPPGYKWEFRDGPDFYVWVLSEPKEAGKRARSGIGVYVGHFPNPSKTAAAEGQIAGRVCGRDVTWLVERSDTEADPWVRRDAVIEYVHGPEYTPVKLHVWVWGPSDAVVAELADQLAGLTLSSRKQPQVDPNKPPAM